ncbi:DUF6680 family protein [Alloacidobacterium sp.]|uniref:DUF6680 family protein n=1 Tax=Alloacidobacterium sp. TaxID=2951999 RepID=UPI002D3284A4|nr:DUF6680 family protein [Alloacidobacterium sp.]HYK35685.1 DUF6680 family protein [Alloacidobacterium sp.]
MDKTLVALNILTILAVVAGPIIALQIQRKLDRDREARNRKMWIFKTLMSLRATALSPTFVQALNQIDVEFNADNEKEKAVRGAWRVLLDHYVDLAHAAEPNSPTLLEKSIQLKTNLLLVMGRCLNYDFDEVQIKKGSYYPTGLGDVETEQNLIRRGLLNVLSGRARIPVAVFEEKFPAITIAPLKEPSAPES